MNSISDKLNSLGLDLQQPVPAVGNYVPSLQVGNMLYISGQLPIKGGAIAYTGHVFGMIDLRCGVDRRGERSKVEDHPERMTVGRRTTNALSGQIAIGAAQLCCLNIIAQIAAAVNDDIDQVAQIVRLGGFVQCYPKFEEHAKIINGASDLMVDVFGEKVGKHVRAATGAVSLPLSAPVEIEATVLLKG